MLCLLLLQHLCAWDGTLCLSHGDLDISVFTTAVAFPGSGKSQHVQTQALHGDARFENPAGAYGYFLAWDLSGGVHRRW